MPRNKLKNEAVAEFLINFEEFENKIRHDFRVYDMASLKNSN